MIAHAAAWDDARVRELHRGAEPHERAGRERVDRDDRVGCTARTVPRSVSIASMPVRPKTPGVSTLTEQNAENAPFCRRWRVTSTCSALLGPMASGVIFALPSPATSTLFTFSPSSALSSAPTARDARSSTSSAFFCSGEEVDRHIPPAGLAELARRALGVDAHARHAAPAAKNRPAVHAGECLRAASRAEQLVRLHGKIGAVLEHFASLLLLNLVFLPYFIHKVLCHTKKSENFEKMLAISCILC